MSEPVPAAFGAPPADPPQPEPKRSRQGCLTCRSRKKKCGEERKPEWGGACERCFLSSYECKWPPPPGQRPVRTFVKGVRTAAKAAKKAAAGQPGPSNGSGATASGGAGASSGTASHSQSPVPPQPFLATSAPAVALPPQPRPPLPPSYPSFASQPPPVSHIQPTAFSSHALSGPYRPPPPAPAPAPLPYSAPSAALPPPAPVLPQTTLPAVDALFPHQSLSTDFSTDIFGQYASIFNPGDELNNLFASIDSEFTHWDANQLAAGSTSESPASAAQYPSPATVAQGSGLGAGSGNGSGSSALASLLTDNVRASTVASPTHASAANGADEERLDPAYNEFNESWFASLPKPVRQVVNEKIFKLATTSVSSRSAGMAMVMLYRVRLQQQKQHHDSSDPAEAALVAQQQQRLLDMSNSYFQKALDHLSVKDVPLEAKVLACLDLLTFQFDQFGAAACHAILLLTEFFITEALGQQPILDLSSIQDSLPILLIPYAWTDVLRSVTVPKRRTLFAFPSLPGDSASTTSSQPWVCPPSAVQAHLGLPVHLMLCLSAVANLSSEMDALPDEVVKVKAEAIERAIRDFRPPPPDAQDLAEGALYLEKVGTAEMWRHAVIIYLYQSVHGHGPISHVITDALRHILSIGSRLLQVYSPPTSILDPLATSSSSSSPAVASLAPPPASSTGAPTSTHAAAGQERTTYLSPPVWRDGPWFLAGTVALLPQDRELCRQGVRACGNMQGYRDNLAALERLWKEEDAKGWVMDWREFLQKERLVVGFL
ncbi:hypothetical protein JCM8097_005178 [Rhodosporidiobolus ruineniae]